MQEIDLHGKLAIVSGGGGEIGHALCAGLADAGAEVVALDINTDRVTGGREAVTGLNVDLRDSSQIESAATRIRQDHGSVDIFVHAAGINIASPIDDVSEASWDAVFSVNLKSAFFLTKALLPHFREGATGKIVFISSISARVGYPGLHAYSASKGGLDALVRNLSTELASRNICVNGIAPGTTKTEMTRGLWEDAEKRRAHAATIPLGRIADPQDHVGPALFFCSSMSDYVTGQILCCDGGLTAVQTDFIDCNLRGKND